MERKKRNEGESFGREGQGEGLMDPRFVGARNSETDGRTNGRTDGCETYGGIETAINVLKDPELFAFERDQSRSFLETF